MKYLSCGSSDRLVGCWGVWEVQAPPTPWAGVEPNLAVAPPPRGSPQPRPPPMKAQSYGQYP